MLQDSFLRQSFFDTSDNMILDKLILVAISETHLVMAPLVQPSEICVRELRSKST